MDMDYKQKYLKYKRKYKNLYFGGTKDIETCDNDLQPNVPVVYIKGSSSQDYKFSDCHGYIIKKIKEIVTEFINNHKINGLKLYESVNKTQEEYKEDLFLRILNILDKLLGKKEIGQPLKPLFYNNQHGISNIYIDGGCGELKKISSGYIWVTVDKYCLQILFFTTVGFKNFVIYPEPDKINYNLREEMFNYNTQFKRDSDLPKREVPYDTNILFKYSELIFVNTEYNENYIELIKKEPYIDIQQVNNLIKYMYSLYISKKTYFLAILGKVRFSVNTSCVMDSSIEKKAFTKKLQKSAVASYLKSIHKADLSRAAIDSYIRTNEIFSNLLFKNCNLGFITGGFFGNYDNVCGVTRTGYEMAKKYEKPIISIMCNAGRFNKNKFTDVDLFFGMHWGDDTPALTSFTDGGIMISPFGAWSHIELFYLRYKKKPCVIYFEDEYVIFLNEFINKSDNIKYFTDTQLFIYDIFINNHNKISDLFLKEFELLESDIFGIATILKNLKIIKKDDKLKLIDEFAETYARENNLENLFTIWFPHFIDNKDLKYGVPVFSDYSDMSKYILNKLSPKDIDKKIELFEAYMKNTPELIEFINKPAYDISLNRNLENSFDITTGMYSADIITNKPIKYTFEKPLNLVVSDIEETKKNTSTDSSKNNSSKSSTKVDEPIYDLVL